MIELALKAKLPFIAVQTDDLLNYRAVLASLTSRTLAEKLPTNEKLLGVGDKVYVTDDTDYVKIEWLRKFTETGNTLVVINAKASLLLFDAGILPTPVKLLQRTLEDMCGPGVDVEPLLQPLKGLSLKTATEVLLLTQARTGAMAPSEIRRTRGSINESIKGLSSMETSYDFYELPEHLKAWLDLNTKYFVSGQTPKLMPRGLLLAGPPGVGKSMAAKAIANAFNCPLYRLDVATSLDKYIGQSENRIAQILRMVEAEAPCVLLMDEVEKLFGDEGDAGVTTRLLSMLLWWLSEHRAQVFTVMTTNDASIIPPELYRPGRMDAKMDLGPMPLKDAVIFAHKVLQVTLGKKPPLAMTKHLTEVVKEKSTGLMAHALVTELVYHEIKAKNWM